MEIGTLPMLNCLLQHTLRSFCSCSSDSSQPSAKWVYAVLWRILPRNFPPPKWEYGSCTVDRSKGIKRNWILVWEDGYCDFHHCQRAGLGHANEGFGADVFFKMSHEVYNYGEGLVGKVASEKCHKWVFIDGQRENEGNILSAWNVSFDVVCYYMNAKTRTRAIFILLLYVPMQQPRAWEVQFNSGIQTIALVSVREGIIQLGSLDKVAEDRNCNSIQRKLSSLQSLTGILATQRPHLPIQHLQPNILPPRLQGNVKQSLDGKRQCDHLPNNPYAQLVHKSLNLGWNSPHNGRRLPPVLPIPPLYPYAEVCDQGHVKDISSYGSVSTTLKTSIDRHGLELISTEKHETASSMELQEQSEFHLTHLGLSHAADLELEMNNQESKTLSLI